MEGNLLRSNRYTSNHIMLQAPCWTEAEDSADHAGAMDELTVDLQPTSGVPSTQLLFRLHPFNLQRPHGRFCSKVVEIFAFVNDGTIYGILL
jgi:hypothetical protein